MTVVERNPGKPAKSFERLLRPIRMPKTDRQETTAQQLGGGIDIQSARGVGTTIDLLLPVTMTNIQKPAEVSQAVASFGHAGTALLVDDEEFVRISTAAAFNPLGYNVVEAPSAEHALSLLQHGLCPDVVVTDHVIPSINGTELARYVQDQCPAAKMLTMSGYADAQGIASYLPRLTKPFRNKELAAALAALGAAQV